MPPSFRIAILLVLTSCSLGAAPDFRRDVAPILRRSCAGCHNDQDREAEFSVETHASLLEGGETREAILPGNAEGSYLYQTLTHQKKPHMPPRKEPQPTGAHLETIRAWIDAGAMAPNSDVSILANLITPELPPAPGPTAITARAESPDGVLRATAGYGTLVFGTHTHDNLPGKVNGLAFSPDGSLLAAATGVTGLRGAAHLYEVATGSESLLLEGHRDILTDLAFSPDGKWLATASYDKTIRLWDPISGELRHELTGHNGAVHGIAFSPDSRTLASAGADNSIKIWRVDSGQRLDTRAQPTGEQYNVSFTPDGSHFLATGADSQIRLWKLLSRQQPAINPLVLVRFAHESEIIEHELMPDGNVLVTTDADGASKRWSLPGLELLGGSTVPAETQTNASDTPIEIDEQLSSSPELSLPGRADAVLQSAFQLYSFSAKKGEEWVFEIEAARQKSPLDSKLEILHPDGAPVERVRLQAMQESWLTFRGKDSKTSGDFRLFKWDEMSLNQLLYINGEVVKLWHYPRGPDSGYIVYPGSGNRRTYFDTTPLAHPLGQPAYIVDPLPAGVEPVPNGLPSFTLHYANDDDATGKLGNDSKLTFTVPDDGDYILRVSDVRGYHGENFNYSLTARPRRPDFKVSLGAFADGVPEGSGREFSVKAERLDDFEGPIQIDITEVPKGFYVTTPIIIEAGQSVAYGSVHLALEESEQDSQKAESDESVEVAKVTATATIGGETVTRPVDDLGNLKPLPKPKVLVTVLPPDGELPLDHSLTRPLEFTIAPGETISARVRIERNGIDGRVSLGSHDAGRNLPHGVYVDNIGLSGLLIVEGQTERDFFITCDHWVPETTRLFHLKTGEEKGIASQPVLLHVRNLPTAKISITAGVPELCFRGLSRVAPVRLCAAHRRSITTAVP